MYVFSPANKKRLHTNTAYLQTEWLNPNSREARRRKERIEERKNSKRKNKSCRMLPAPATATNKPPTHHESHRPKKPCDHHSKRHHHSATDAPQSARKGQQV